MAAADARVHAAAMSMAETDASRAASTSCDSGLNSHVKTAIKEGSAELTAAETPSSETGMGNLQSEQMAAAAGRGQRVGWRTVSVAVASVLVLAVAVFAASPMLARSIRPKFRVGVDGTRIFTAEELKQFNGLNGKPMYVAIIGDVFDVSSGTKFYKAGRSYAHFVGRDATRAFSTGESSPEGLTDAIDGLTDEQLGGIAEWHGFYQKHETYKHVGRLAGRYYDLRGRGRLAFPWERLAQRQKAEEQRRQEFPGCNSKWTQKDGSVVWCTPRSGGVTRAWAGVPRLMTPRDGSETRCVCVLPSRANSPELTPYEGCPLDAERCKIEPNV
eukprot:193211-Pleurochrysis_carterae.AAC.5